MAGVLCVGHAVHDFVFSVDQFPQHAGKHRATNFDSVGGGPAATAAVAIVRLGGSAQLAARIGDDAVGGLIAAELESYGVDCRWLRHMPDCSSSVSAVFVDRRGERLIVNHLDARLPVDAAWLPEPRVAGVAAVLADTRWPLGALAGLRAARAAGLPAILDADTPIPRDGLLLEAASHVAFSSEALLEFTGLAELEPAVLEVAGRLSGWCCVTAGARGVLVVDHGRLVRHPAHAVPVVDTLGAGDVWHGAFALALAEGCDEAAAVRFASAAAALKVQRRGGRRGVPLRAEVDSFLARHAATVSAAHEE